MTLKQKVNISKNIIQKAFDQYGNRLFMTFSGGKDSTVLFDLVKDIFSDIKIIILDTRFEFEETHEFIGQYLSGRNFEIMQCSQQEHEAIMEKYNGQDMIEGQWYCCAHKEPALEQFLKRQSHTGWLTGLRSDETENRTYIGIYQKGKYGVEKINPIIFWTVEDIWEYIKENKLSTHKKYAEGYLSLGCKPCTEAGFRAKKGNQGKFENMGLSGERPQGSECGIHI